MEKEEKNSQLNNPKYFEDLEAKMMQHAQNHPHQTKVQTFPKMMWAAAACLLVGVGIYFLTSNTTEQTEEQTAQQYDFIDTIPRIGQVEKVEQNLKTSVDDVAEQVKPETVKISEPIKEVIIQMVNFEDAEEIIEGEESEEDLLELLTEKELDELLKEYT